MNKSKQQFEEWFNYNGISAGWCSKRDLEFIKNKMYHCWQASRESLINNLPESINCPTSPELIWLQVDPEPEEENKPVYPVNLYSGDVTWSSDREFPTDTLYIRADLIKK